jgi:CBS domain-containing protein
MPVVKTRNVMTGLLVNEAMQRRVLRLPKSASLGKCINQLIKFKLNGLLVLDSSLCPVGVVSKTDLVGAFYGGLPVESLLGDIMNGPLLTCFPDDAVEVCLNVMRTHGVHQLYVQGAEPCSIIGMLSYPDVVGLLYRYCRSCPQSTIRKVERSNHFDLAQPLTVKEIMTKSVISCNEEDSLAEVIEELMTHRLGAVLVRDAHGRACGVISKTDIVVSYNHGTSLDVEARSVMQSPVVSCDQQSSLTEALRHMFLNDVQRLFIHDGDSGHIIGVLSLSDVAQVRSGSCRACSASQIITAP